MKFWFIALIMIPLMGLGQEAILTGMVWDPIAKAPVEAAEIRVYLGQTQGEVRATTGVDGKFVIYHEMQPFNIDYAIVIEKENYHLLNGTVRLNYGEGADRRFNLYKRKAAEVPIVKMDRQDGPSLLGAPTNNLTFLIDVSGSMAEQNRLENLKESLLFLVGLYRQEDQISIITYSSSVEVYLEGARISQMEDITKIIKSLQPTGKTEGVAGLVRAYDIAASRYLRGGNNKVILATDGIFGEDKKSRKLVDEVIMRGRSQDVKLSIFSFGEEAASINERLDSWSRLGIGNHTHINTLEEAKEQIVLEAQGK